MSQKEQLKNKYKRKNYIIKYSNFTKIVKENDIIMQEIGIEYLLYKMKTVLPLDGDFLLENLNFNIFLELLNKIEENKEMNSLKENSTEPNKDKLGISLRNVDSLK